MHIDRIISVGRQIDRIVSGTVLFLEEDHYVSEDFLYVLKMMKEESEKLPEGQVRLFS